MSVLLKFGDSTIVTKKVPGPVKPQEDTNVNLKIAHSPPLPREKMDTAGVGQSYTRVGLWLALPLKPSKLTPCL